MKNPGQPESRNLLFSTSSAEKYKISNRESPNIVRVNNYLKHLMSKQLFKTSSFN